MNKTTHIHPNLVRASIEGVDLIFNKSIYADKVVHRLLKSNRKWGARDRRFIAETLYDAVRWKRLYMEVSGIEHFGGERHITAFLAVQWTLKGYHFPGGEKAGIPGRKTIALRYRKALEYRPVRESVPDWLDELGSKELGEEVWEKELRAQNAQAPVILRVNTLKINPYELKKILSKDGISTYMDPAYPEALFLEKRASVFQTQAYRDGLFEMQDASSQLVARLLDPSPGHRVIDACAGAGGKSLHLAALMQNKGQIIAMDVHPYKLEKLKQRAKRNGVHNIRTRTIDHKKIIKRMYGTADRLLIDAPCSGLGVLRRNPDYKWKLSPGSIRELTGIQSELLDDYSKMLKPGGKMVYATCSVLPQENEKQVERFLNRHPGYTLVEEKKILTHITGNDGFYMALIQRNDS